MSAGGWADGRMGRKTTAPTSATPNSPTAHPPIRPSLLPRISHPPDLSAAVVAHEQGSVRKNQQAHGAPPTLDVGALPPHDEILHSCRAASIAVHVDPHDFCARRNRTIPRAEQRHERVAAIVGGELRARVERESE